VPGTTQTDVAPQRLATTLTIGRRGNADSFVDGVLDELRLSAQPRSADWIAGQYASMTDTLITYGAPQPR
jgi:hypothetical protein